MADFRSHIVLLLLAIHTHSIVCVSWDRMHCSTDTTQEMPEGTVENIGRFPWLGIVQHTFLIAGKTHYAVTGAVLIHPAFAIAAAEDIVKITPDQLVNNTKLILWDSRSNKYALDVKDYILHPEYLDKVTFATIALLDLIAWGEAELSEWRAPVRPICMPVKGFGTYENKTYAVKMSDKYGTMEKEILKMNYVENKVCEEFYYRRNLTFSKMNPTNPLCAVSEFSNQPCVWDAGTALITRQSWGFWKLLGFAVRGPGCGAPTRFLNIHDYVPWINDVISQIPYEDAAETYKIGVRRASPVKLIMYKANANVPKAIGACSRGHRGNVLFKDSSEISANKNFVQGFYFLVITTLAEFRCAIVDLEVSRRSNAGLWLEHNCHRDMMGLHHGHEKPFREKMSCFLYFKTSAFLELRFFFSFKAMVDVSMYGIDHKKTHIPNPFKSSQHTQPWWPTQNRLKIGKFAPFNLNDWYL